MMRQDDDYTVRLVDLPYAVRGLVCVDEDGWPNIYLNARLTREMNQESMEHEIKHLEDGDVYSYKPIQKVEALP